MLVGIAVTEAGWRRREVFSLYSRRTPLQLVAHSIQRSVPVGYSYYFTRIIMVLNSLTQVITGLKDILTQVYNNWFAGTVVCYFSQQQDAFQTSARLYSNKY